jgi:hypothetical protein
LSAVLESNANSNQLTNVTDNGHSANDIGHQYHFISKSTTDISYDSNGNAVSIPYKGVTVAYNRRTRRFSFLQLVEKEKENAVMASGE